MDKPSCRICNKNQARNKGRRKDGSIKYDTKCNTCRRHKHGGLTWEAYRATVYKGPDGGKRSPQSRRRKNRKAEIRRRPWLAYRGDSCERCGFVAEHPSQLDVDHIDGNRLNNDPSNYMTLCANCHRLKTITNGDHLTPAGVSMPVVGAVQHKLFH